MLSNRNATINTRLFVLIWCALFARLGTTAFAQQLELLQTIALTNGGEIVDYRSTDQVLAITMERGVELLTLSENGEVGPSLEVRIAESLGDLSAIASISSVALDPASRGFGATTVILQSELGQRGRVVFFDTTTGRVCRVMEAGYHPDSLVFSRDGQRLFVVNEGEYTVGGDNDPPGSLMMIDLSEVHDAETLSGARFDGDFPLTPWSIGPRVDLSVLRINDHTTTQAYRHVEPEYAAVINGLVYVTLQENNAIGVFDPQRRQWVAVWPLGQVPVTIDASDTDKQALIVDEVFGLPMPDTLTVFKTKGQRVIATADEGDYRVDDGDTMRVGEFPATNFAEPSTLTARLHVSIPDSDPDADGELDRLVTAGTRGVSLWNARTGQRIGGSGSLEQWLFLQDPGRHNFDAKSPEKSIDSRSDDKGPEPEGLDAIVLPDGTALLAVAMERQNGIALLDVTDPANLTPVAYRNDFDHGLVAPESVKWIRFTDDGPPWLLVGYEGGKDGRGCGVGVYQLVP